MIVGFHPLKKDWLRKDWLRKDWPYKRISACRQKANCRIGWHKIETPERRHRPPHRRRTKKMRLYRNGTDICFDKAHDMITHEIKYVRLIPPILNDQRLFFSFLRAFSATDTFFIINHGSFKILLAQSADGTCLYRGTFVVLRAVLFSDF